LLRDSLPRVVAALLAGAIGNAFAQGAGLVGTPIDPERIKKGEAVYMRNCAACHQPNGRGVSIFPPLAGAPILDDLPQLMEVVLYGTPRTAMPNFCSLHAEELGQLFTYLRNAWGKEGHESVEADEVLQVVAENPSRRCATAELSRSPLAETVFEFGFGSLQPSEILRFAAHMESAMRASGKIVREPQGRMHLLIGYPLLGEPAAALPEALRLSPALRGLAACSASEFAARQGASGWRLSRTAARPDPRFANAYEYAFLNEGETLVAKAASGPAQVAFFNDEFHAACSMTMSAAHQWPAPWPVRNAQANAAFKIAGCDKLAAVQDGREIAATDGEIRLARRPFALRYTGAGQPALHVARYPELSHALSRLGRHQIVGSADDYMALLPRDLPLRSDFRLSAQADTPGFIPMAGGGFKPEAGGASHIFEVDSVGGVPLRQLLPLTLHTTYFGVLERIDPKRRDLRMSWGACRLVFE